MTKLIRKALDALNSVANRRATVRIGYRLPLGLSLAAVCLLSGWFVFTVLARPTRTPILTLTSIYGPAWDPNPWVAEDLNAINRLGESTFTVQPLPSIDQLSSGFWDRADDLFRQAIRDCSDDVPLTIYVNLHGAVNDDGKPCWIPPNAAVDDASTWFPIESFLDQLVQAQENSRKLPVVLILECGRVRSHWPAGITNNQFDQRLGELVTAHAKKHPGSSITVLSSAAYGQWSLFSRRGDGDVFTRFVVDGLSGTADGYGQTKARDGAVDSGELYRYVHDHVAHWAIHHRGVSQNPTLHQAGVQKPVVIGRVGRLGSPTAATRTPAPSQPELDRLHDAVATVTDFRRYDPVAVDPHAWSQIQRTLHGISQSVFGGMAVRATTDRWYSRLDRQLQSLHQKVRQQNNETSQLADLRMNRTANLIWSAVSKRPKRDTAADMVRDIDPDQAMPVPMLHAFLNRPDLSFWAQPDLVHRTAQAQTEWLQCIAKLPDDLFPAAMQITDSVHRSRRQLADTVLANQSARSVRSIAAKHDAISARCEEFEKQVAKQCDLLEQLAAAWQARDRAFVELPYLYQWIDEAPNVVESLVDQNASQLAGVMHLDDLLNRFVNRSLPWNQSLHDQIVVTSTQVNDYLDQLRHVHSSAFSAKGSIAAATSSTKSNDMASVAGSLANASHCGLLANDPYQQARAEQQLYQLDNDLGRRQKCVVSTDGKVRCDHQPDQHEQRTGTKQLSILLGLDPEQADGQSFRLRLRSLSESDPGNQPLDQQWRRIVSLVSNDDLSSAITASKLASRQSRLASVADTILDDFWYSPATNDSPYFAATAESFLGIADAALPESPAWRTYKRSLEAKLASRRSAASTGILVQAQTQPSYASTPAQTVSVSVHASGIGTNLPEGTASVSIRDSVGKQETLHAGSEAMLPLFKNNPDQELDLTLASKLNAESLALVVFRGNRFQSSIVPCDTTYGVSSDHNSGTQSAQITVSNGMESKRAICFVLDCSASMHESVESEMARSQPNSKADPLPISSASKLDAARTSLYQMLRLLRSGDTEVGLVLYGHRMAIGTGDQGLLLQKRYHRRFPFAPTLQPYADVEVALPTGRFGDVELELARQRFQATVPWGQTPLYLAISNAIDDLARSNEQTAKDIIVISDGRNYQFNPLPDAIVPLQTLVEKAKQHQVRVHIIGFGISEKESAAAAAEFKAIAHGSGGDTFTDIHHSTDLLRRLKQFSAPDNFSVQIGTGKPSATPFGKTVSIPSIKATNTALQLTVGGQQTTLPISPGSHLRLLADAASGSARSVAYQKGYPQFVPLVDDAGQPRATRLGVHQPIRQQDDLRFQLSFQRADQFVSKRPAMAWVELMPRRQSDSQTLEPQSIGKFGYRTDAVHWIDGTPCPVAEFVCRRWPEDATQYVVQAWCRESAPSGTTIQIPIDQTEFAPLLNHPGIQFRVDRSAGKVQLHFRYRQATDGSNGDGSEGDRSDHRDRMMIVRLPASPTTESTHWYDDVKNTSVHTFVMVANAGVELNPPLANADPDHLECWICPIAEAKSGALRTEHVVEGELTTSLTRVQATQYR